MIDAGSGMESVLIQRTPRELAAYALVCLRFQGMPSLWATCCTEGWHLTDVQRLVAWGRTQDISGTALGNLLKRYGSHRHWSGPCMQLLDPSRSPYEKSARRCNMRRKVLPTCASVRRGL
jgi:hypothetical protein